MWEAKAAPGRGAELLGWAREYAVPALAAAERVELLSAPGERVLLISWWAPGTEPVAPPEPASDLLARPVHRWSFQREYVTEAR